MMLRVVIVIMRKHSLHAFREALVAAGVPMAVVAKAVAELANRLTELPAASVESPDMTPKEVGAYRRESPSTVQRKMRAGVYRSYLSGADKRLITRESVEADRDACLAAGSGFSERAGADPETTEV
jgi:hypothetical protein